MMHFCSPSFQTKFGAISIALFSVCVVATHAQAPEYFTLQGLITDHSGDPITGYHSMTLRLYDGGVEVYSQTEAGTTTDGMFNMHVGPLDSVVFGKPLQIGITIDSDPEMPREDLESAPYALGLRGLRVEYSSTAGKAPNLIGGATTNDIGDGLWGVTIDGGGGYAADEENFVAGNFGVIGGGYGNRIGSSLASMATIGGGSDNLISGNSFKSTICGGSENEVTGQGGAIAGGFGNVVNIRGAVGGGAENLAVGSHATIPGGRWNRAAGDYSFAAGKYARANHSGSFVWQDATAGSYDDTLSTWAANQLRIRASGGFYFQTAAAPNLSTGARLDSDEGAWEALSSRAAKKDFAPVDAAEILSKVAELDVSSWRYETQDLPVRHIGPVSEDFYAAFGFGSDDTHISTIDADGVALAAIKGLYEVVKEQQAEIEKLRRLLIDNR